MSVAASPCPVCGEACAEWQASRALGERPPVEQPWPRAHVVRQRVFDVHGRLLYGEGQVISLEEAEQLGLRSPDEPAGDAPDDDDEARAVKPDANRMRRKGEDRMRRLAEDR